VARPSFAGFVVVVEFVERIVIVVLRAVIWSTSIGGFITNTVTETIGSPFVTVMPTGAQAVTVVREQNLRQPRLDVHPGRARARGDEGAPRDVVLTIGKTKCQS